MNRSQSSFPYRRDRALPLLRAALIAAGLVTTTASAQVQKAGDLLVDVDATQLAPGPLASIPNNGTMGGFFEAVGGTANTPVIATVDGNQGHPV